MSQIELCLVFKKGRIPKPRGARNIRQKVTWRKGKHSEKPQEVRRRITRMFPTQKKIELFARVRNNLFIDDDKKWLEDNHWTLWGNEA